MLNTRRHSLDIPHRSWITISLRVSSTTVGVGDGGEYWGCDHRNMILLIYIYEEFLQSSQYVTKSNIEIKLILYQDIMYNLTFHNFI